MCFANGMQFTPVTLPGESASVKKEPRVHVMQWSRYVYLGRGYPSLSKDSKYNLTPFT